MSHFLMSGNEAIARGAYEAGVKVASAYPGTPSTEILENLVNFPDVDASWAPNEKVALEVGIGASFAGVRSLVTMKHVGVNVAADPLFTLSYIGVRGGLVLACADDPEMHSSQNEQDSRNYAKFAKVPMFEPADSEEARAFTRLAFEVSEQFDTPVMLRSNTRISHGKSVVKPQEPVDGLPAPGILRDPGKMVMLPANARKRHPLVEERIATLESWACEQPFNRIEEGPSDIGVITSGISYQYARQLLPDAHILKLGMVYPLPKQLIRDFAARCKTLYVIEELDPFIEEQVKAMGIEVLGKELIPRCGELTPERLESALHGRQPETAHQHTEALPGRPPNMCAGCSHRGVFYTLKRLDAFVTGDIGCYTLGFLPPLSAMDTCVCMGAGISNATGMIKALPEQERSRIVGVMGDSTFLHTGINSLIDMAYNGNHGTVVLLDNRVTAMTGRQENPGSGYTLGGVESPPIDLGALCRVIGVQHVEMIDPYDLTQTEQVLRQEMERTELSVVIAKRPCMLDRRHGPEPTPALTVVADRCSGCRLCLKIGCPAISWQQDQTEPKALIDSHLCSGCGLCRQLCKFEAIEVHDE